MHPDDPAGVAQSEESGLARLLATYVDLLHHELPLLLRMTLANGPWRNASSEQRAAQLSEMIEHFRTIGMSDEKILQELSDDHP